MSLMVLGWIIFDLDYTCDKTDELLFQGESQVRWILTLCSNWNSHHTAKFLLCYYGSFITKQKSTSQHGQLFVCFYLFIELFLKVVQWFWLLTQEWGSVLEPVSWLGPHLLVVAIESLFLPSVYKCTTWMLTALLLHAGVHVNQQQRTHNSCELGSGLCAKVITHMSTQVKCSVFKSQHHWQRRPIEMQLMNTSARVFVSVSFRGWSEFGWVSLSLFTLWLTMNWQGDNCVVGFIDSKSKFDQIHRGPLPKMNCELRTCSFLRPLDCKHYITTAF